MPLIPQGSLVVVTGGNGYIGSHVIDQLLVHGYRVRTTVRSASESSWLLATFQERHPGASLEIVEISDISVDGALNKALEGVSGLVHVASDTSFGSNPNIVVNSATHSTVNILKAAAKAPSVKRVVLTSSIVAAASGPRPAEETITPETWNEKAVKLAWADPPYEASRGSTVYAASNTQGEQAAWEFIKSHKPHYTFNAVLPSMNLGAFINLEKQKDRTTAGWVRALFRGDTGRIEQTESGMYVDVADVARLHVVALIRADVANERIFAVAGPHTWNDALRVWREGFPAKANQLPPDFPSTSKAAQRNLRKWPNERALALLKDIKGSGWEPYERTLLETVRDLA